jgi:hypothetical protein
MRDDPNERDALLNHAHPSEPADRDERAELPAELAPTHRALSQLAAAWSATTPAANRLAAFARQLPAQRAATPAPDDTPTLRMRALPQRPPSGAPPRPSGGRQLAGVAAAVVIVGLLAATLLRLAPGRTGATTQATPTATAPAPTATPVPEEASHQPPNSAWATVSHERLVPAPSDGRIVYETQGTTARVSSDGGATWHALKLPTFSQAHVTSEQASLAVGDADPRLVLLSITLSLDSANPADCPAGSTNSDQIALHGGILASGFVTCNAYFVSHDGGGSWTHSHMFYTAFNQPIVWQLGDTLYGQRDDVDTSPSATFPLVGVRLMASHDGGISWSYADTTLKRQAGYVCSVLPVAEDGALYAVTFTSPCFSGTTGEHIVWRSVDGGATWSQLSSTKGSYAALVASAPAANGHGFWLYMRSNLSNQTQRLLVSEDGGASWSAIPAAAQASGGVSIQAANGALSDGSLVVALIAQASGTAGASPGKATFYAWRPEDTAWRPLTPPLTAYYSAFFSGNTPIIITHGGRNATDTLYVLDGGLLPAGQTAATHLYAIR